MSAGSLDSTLTLAISLPGRWNAFRDKRWHGVTFGGTAEVIMIGAIRVGIVDSINAAACSGRVYFDDLGLVSAELPVLQGGCGDYQTYSLPCVGDQVLCVFTDPDGEVQEAGFIVGALFSDEDKPSKSGAGLRYVKFADGGSLEYDAGASTLKIVAGGGVTITGNVTVNGNIHATGNITAVGTVNGGA